MCKPTLKLGAVCILLVLTGCSTIGSLGLPIASGPHRLLRTAGKLRDTAGHGELPHELAKSVQVPHHVEPGDVLIVEPIDFDSPLRFPPDQIVQADGTIDLGEFGRLPVAGNTVEDIKHQVDAMVSDPMQPRYVESDASGMMTQEPPDPLETPRPRGVSVRLVSNESAVVYVMGEVNAPGTYPLTGRETVLDAIVNAGGPTEQADEHRMILTRPRRADEPRLVLPICFRQIVQLGDTTSNYQVLPSDRIYVPSMTILQDIKQSCSLTDKGCPSCVEFVN